MASPELSRLSTEFKGQFGIQAHKPEGHHDVQPTVVKQEHEAVDKIKAAILSHGNPFAVEGNQLYSFITHAYVPQEYVPQIFNVNDIGQKLYKDYVTERINGDVSLWAPVKKQNNKMYMSGNKKHTIKVLDQTVDLKETKNLYGRLIVLTRSNRDINQKNAIGNYVTPRAHFAQDGSMLPCTDKSKLIHNLEKLAKTEDTDFPAANEYGDSSATSSTNPMIAIVDGMVLVQKMTTKKGTLSTVKDLVQSFNDRLTSLTVGFSEVILVFDIYKSNSLKGKTRERRRQGKAPIQYQIADDTKIKHIPLMQFLSHEKTKADLTEYLAKTTLGYKKNSPQLVITSASGHTESNRNLHFENNKHEEADTLMVCLAEASQRSPDAQLVFFTSDTDVLVLAVAHYDKLFKNTSLSMVSGMVDIAPIWRALGKEKAEALPIFLVTGVDNIGKVSGIGKTKWFQVHMKADLDLPRAFMKLPVEGDLTQEVKTN